MLEAQVERRLKRLRASGFEVLKLRTPGKNGVMDRMILWPRYAPSPPVFVEIKQPSKVLRPLQEAVQNDWRKRGCDVRDMCDTYEKIDTLICQLLHELRPIA